MIAAGYAFGTVFQRAPAERRRWTWRVGLALTLGFVLLRAANVYGDHRLWSVQKGGLFTALSFVNCTKYPPSLLFLMMTLGPAAIALALFERRHGTLGRTLALFGRVPLFFYLLHLPLIHGVAVALSYLRYGQASWLFQTPPARDAAATFPAGYGYGLGWLVLIWLAVVLALCPACGWFAAYKRGSRAVWLSYL